MSPVPSPATSANLNPADASANQLLLTQASWIRSKLPRNGAGPHQLLEATTSEPAARIQCTGSVQGTSPAFRRRIRTVRDPFVYQDLVAHPKGASGIYGGMLTESGHAGVRGLEPVGPQRPGRLRTALSAGRLVHGRHR